MLLYLLRISTNAFVVRFPIIHCSLYFPHVKFHSWILIYYCLQQWAKAFSHLVLPLSFLVTFGLLFVMRYCTLLCAWLPVSASICGTPQVAVHKGQCWQLEDCITVALSCLVNNLNQFVIWEYFTFFTAVMWLWSLAENVVVTQFRY